MQRRSFLKWAIHGMGALFGAILGIPAVTYLIDSRNRPTREGDFKTAARLSDLPPGVPTQAVITDVRTDAWTLHPNDVVGRVWLIRRQDGEVDAFTTICPHLGCSVNFDGKRFVCPCHGGTFHLSGERFSKEELHKEKLGDENPAPRGMDKLEVRRDPANPKLIQVKYQNFIPGKEKAEPKA